MTDDKSNEVRKPLVLIADDDFKSLSLLGNILRKAGYDIAPAENGIKAIEIAIKKKPDLVLLDVKMPGMDGYEVCKTLKESEKTKDIPIIFITGKANDMVDILKGFREKAVDYIVKPFNNEELLARINVHIELKKAKEAIEKYKQKEGVYIMARTANHDINQPLSVLKGNLELFNKTIRKSVEPGQCSLTDKQIGYLAKIEKSAEKITSILNKYLDAESKSIHFEPYSETQEIVSFDDEPVGG